MPSSGTSNAYRWIYGTTQNLAPYKYAANQFKQMSDEAVVRAAAVKGGMPIKTEMQDLIYKQSGLSSYVDVAERIEVFEDENSVYVGVQDRSMVDRALQMDDFFPVLDTAFELAAPKALAAFEQALSESAF